MKYLKFAAVFVGVSLMLPVVIIGAVTAFYLAAFKIGFQMVSDGI